MRLRGAPRGTRAALGAGVGGPGPPPPAPQDGPAQLAHADKRHSPLPVQAQDPLQLIQKVAYVVSAPLLSEATEVAEVLADLGGGDTQTGAQLLGAHDLAALCLEGGQGPRI